MMRLLFEVEVVDPPILKTGCRFKLLKILEMVTAPAHGHCSGSSKLARSVFVPTQLDENQVSREFGSSIRGIG
jgi:hypothetical protein